MYDKYIKRVIDIVIALIFLIPIVIINIILAFFIKLEDGGPVFYKAKRIGKYGKIFDMYKLRSMKVNAPDIRLKDGSTYNGDDDPRLTKFGKIARKTSIDELPQIYNVLKGDMSLIGPRPDSAYYLESYTDEEKIILNVRPGITGYNQAINRNSVGTKEKLQNDIYYVKHLSFLFDIKIIFLTINAVLKHKNVYRSDAESKTIIKNINEGENSEKENNDIGSKYTTITSDSKSN